MEEEQVDEQKTHETGKRNDSIRRREEKLRRRQQENCRTIVISVSSTYFLVSSFKLQIPVKIHIFEI